MKRHILYSLLVCFGLLFFTSAFALKEENSAAGLIQHGPGSALEDKDINRFTNAIAEIKEYYVKPINDKKLLEDAIRGMLTGLDPHSEYLDEDSYKTLLMTTNGEFAGLGIEVTGDLGVLKVVSPIDDTPAAKAGIKSGDYIVALDGKLVSEMTLREAVDRMRGKKGTDISLTVIRKSEKAPMNFKLTRESIRIPSVKSYMLDNNFAYVRITQFQEPTTELMIAAIETLKKQTKGNIKGLILDLRNNPGGLLETAVQITDTFLDDKTMDAYHKLVVYTEGRQPKAEYKAKDKDKDILNGAPMVILINDGSASASEIVAGALQDYHRAIIVGTTSFGKGSVQTVLPLDTSHAIKLTTALYHTPAGRVIQNIGIQPDITIDNLTVNGGTKVDNAMLAPIKEYQLKGHLAGTATEPGAPVKKDLANLAQEDFQLYEAVKILKTMSMAEQNVGVGTHLNPSNTVAKLP